MLSYTGFVPASESSDDTAYASGVAGPAGDETEVPSDNEEGVGVLSYDGNNEAEAVLGLEPEVGSVPGGMIRISVHGPLRSPSESNLPSANYGTTTAHEGLQPRRRVSVPISTSSSQQHQQLNNNGNGETRITTQELLAEIRSIIDGDGEERRSVDKDGTTVGSDNCPTNGTSFAPDEEADDEGNEEGEERRSRSRSPTADLNALGRLLIQQLPKRLEVLKEENKRLLSEAADTQSNLKERETEVVEQKELLTTLQDKVSQQVRVEMELRNELELKQKVIEELTTKIQVATENYETINRYSAE
jgi:hypothetical protein